MVNVTVPLGVPPPGDTTATVAENVTDWPNTEGLADEASVVVVSATFTVWVTAREVLVRRLLLPLYTAVIGWLPAASKLVLNVAVPALSVPVPTVVAPSLNVTVPVGVPAPGVRAVTVAENVTDWPNTDGLSDEPSAVSVLALLTVWVTTAEVLLLKLLSPRYTAVMALLLTLSEEVISVAWPDTSALVTSAVAPSRKITLPVGVPEPGGTAATVAVNVTDCPNTDGFTEEFSVVDAADLLTTWVKLVETLLVKPLSPR